MLPSNTLGKIQQIGETPLNKSPNKLYCDGQRDRQFYVNMTFQFFNMTMKY